MVLTELERPNPDVTSPKLESVAISTNPRTSLIYDNVSSIDLNPDQPTLTINFSETNQPLSATFRRDKAQHLVLWFSDREDPLVLDPNNFALFTTTQPRVFNNSFPLEIL